MKSRALIVRFAASSVMLAITKVIQEPPRWNRVRGKEVGSDWRCLFTTNLETTNGSKWLRTVLIEGANAVAKSKGKYLSERYRQLARRRGKKKATVAIAHEILTAAWQLLSTDEPYRDSGSEVVLTRAQESAKDRPYAGSTLSATSSR